MTECAKKTAIVKESANNSVLFLNRKKHADGSLLLPIKFFSKDSQAALYMWCSLIALPFSKVHNSRLLVAILYYYFLYLKNRSWAQITAGLE